MRARRDTTQGVDANASRKHLDDVAHRVGVNEPETLDRDDEVRAIEKANARATARARRR